MIVQYNNWQFINEKDGKWILLIFKKTWILLRIINEKNDLKIEGINYESKKS